VFPEGPCSGRSHRAPQPINQAKGNARGPPPDFIPGTNAIESLNYQLRKVTKARGSFPSDAAALKLLHLAIRNVNQKRGSTQGPGTYRWTEALNSFAIQFPDRLPL
jgi:transposase-like protein